MKYSKFSSIILSRKVALGLAISLIVSLCFLLSLKQTFEWTFSSIYKTCDNDSQAQGCNFLDKTPEEIFLDYIWKTIPSEVTEVQGIEGKVAFSEGPAFVRFRTNKSFITELIEKDYHNYGSYSLMSCAIFRNVSLHYKLIQDFPEKFEWWRPLDVASPVCYSAQGYQSDDSKHLLIDFDNGIIYFYRSATCGLCPD